MPTTEGLTILSIAALVALVTLSLLFAWSWKAWLAYKQHELEATHGRAATGEATIGNRIELADLRERIRKLEAIAAGVDL